MKHVIVIETPETITISPLRQDVLEGAIEGVLSGQSSSTFIQCRFNVDSAIAAVHEMYNAPKWEPDKQSS